MAVTIIKKVVAPANAPSKEKVMGIDPSTKTGIVLLDQDGGDYANALEFEHASGLERLQLIAQEVGDDLDVLKPKAVFIEAQAYGNRFTIVMMSQIQVLIRLEVWNRGIPLHEVTPLTLKKWVTGDGKADKKKMAKVVKERWGFIHTSNDVVDAYALAKLGQVVLGMEPRTVMKGVNLVK